jgi:hypothetical protein
MWRIVRIAIAMLLACLAINFVHDALRLGPDFLEPDLGGLIDLALLGAAILLAGLSDREYFLGESSRPKHRKRLPLGS